jgi:hypothetical protein
MARGKSKVFADAIGETIVAGAAIAARWGSTNVMEVASERSES